jgi:hypothetical protein
MTWHKDMNTAPWISPEFDLTLDCQPVLMAIEQLTFAQMKRKFFSPVLLNLIIRFIFSYLTLNILYL